MAWIILSIIQTGIAKPQIRVVILIGIIIKERTEGGLNKRAYFVPPYSAHFWFFRIEQSRVRYGDSIFHIFICQLAMQSIYWLESLNHS